MSTTRARAAESMRLPNGTEFMSLSHADTMMIYRDIFDDDCYRQNGITIEDGDCILDVGANTGLFILYLNTICRNVRVFAFEPIPATFDVLRRNVESHNHLSVELFNVGLSDRAGDARFTYYPRMSNMSTMYPDDTEQTTDRDLEYIFDQIPTLRWPLPFLISLVPKFLKNFIAARIRRFYLKGEKVTCKLWNLSEFLRSRKIERIDLLKLDAEKSELPIFSTLTSDDWSRIRQLIIEVHQGDKAVRQLRGMLDARGFHTALAPNPQSRRCRFCMPSSLGPA